MKSEFKDIARRCFSRAIPSLIAIVALLSAPVLRAQTAGDGSIQGTVTDSTGAVVPNATVSATNNATGVTTTRTTSSAGLFNIAPLPPNTYSLKVTATGFQTLVQNSIVVDALQIRTFNPVLQVGQASQTVTVTAAPPVLDTADATLGLTIENETYTNLPVQMNNAQRDPTAFATLTPGTQGGTRLPVVGGTGNYLGQLYLDGMPAETVSQQGDNRLVSQDVDLDAVDQMQVLTSTPPAEYMGAGAENFTMKSGGLRYHGQVSDFFRNTAFDAWSFTAKAATTKNAAGETVPAPKPVEHQNELSASVGGKVPLTGNKLFFFVAYDRYHERRGANPSFFTVPTTLMRSGDFTEIAGAQGTGKIGTGPDNPAVIFDPTTNSCVGGVCTRKPFQAIKNGVLTNNVIPTDELSPIAQKMQSFLPAPTNSSLVNNYFGGVPSGFDNKVFDWRVDFDLSSKQRISSTGAMGWVNYLNNYGTPFLPQPYTGGDLASIFPKDYIVGDTYTISPSLVNQLKFSFTRFFQKIQNSTQGVTAYEAGTMGITNLPPNDAQSAIEFPQESFGTTPAFGSVQSNWTSYGDSSSTQLTTPNNYALTDNVQWVKGKHSLTFGATFQWQEINNANPATYTGVLRLPFNAYSTANYGSNSDTLSLGSAQSPSGYSYASFLLGAVGGSTSDANSSPSIGLHPVSELGGRYHTFSPYAEDNWKITRKLTLNLGLRWDYLPPFHEVKNRWTFLNPNLTNAITGTPGMLQFAGNYGGPGVSCNCRTPVHTWWKNWGPRLGAAYSINDSTVVRAGYAVVFTQAGGVGGRGGAANGTGQTGFNVDAIGPTEVANGAAAGPSFYLNNSSYFTSIGLGNTSLFGPGYTYPTPPAPSVASQTLSTGFYVDPVTGGMVPASSVSYADPYFSSRAPEISMYNLGVERGITKDLTLAVNYVGNESHFIVNSGTTGSNARGYWTNELDPKYLAALGPVLDSTGKSPLLDAPATPANVAILQQKFPDIQAPAFYVQAAQVNKSATVAHMLTHFPQYSGVSDTWGNVGNFSYNSLQITLQQRMAHGLTFNVNYTLAKNIGDDGTFRTGFDIPAAALSHGTRSWKMDRIDRSWTANNTPQIFHAFGVYQLPFGKGKIGNDSRLVRWLAGGWQLSAIYSHASGTPAAVVWTGCSGTTYPGQGQCMPDLNSAYGNHSGRINGNFGKGSGGYQAANLGKVQYFDPSGFATPTNISSASTAQYLIGNAPRTRALHLNNPGSWNLDTGLRRTFPIHEDLQFVFEVDALNTTNHAVFGNPNANWSQGSKSFGTISGLAGGTNPRDFQFAGHINF
jgi:hypothetical protein